LIGSETVGERDTWLVRGTVAREVVDTVTAQTMSGDNIMVELWIDKENSNLLRVRLDEPTDVGLDDPATWTMELREYNEPVTIEPPI
jgi:hypothetical protein